MDPLLYETRHGLMKCFMKIEVYAIEDLLELLGLI